MKQAFYFVLGIALVILTSATTVSVMTVKPSISKSFTVKEFNDKTYCTEQAEYIREMMRKGWILKSQSLAGRNYSLYGIVVMEKY
jgi:hypothetical protein